MTTVHNASTDRPTPGGGPKDQVRIRVQVEGVVQGVGFRPFVYRLATAHGDVYGFLAVVIALLSWFFLGAQLTADINVVARQGLWPRSLT